MTTSLRKPEIGHYWQIPGSRPLKIESIDADIRLVSDDGRTTGVCSVAMFNRLYRYVGGGE